MTMSKQLWPSRYEYLGKAVVLQQPVDPVVGVARLAHHDVPGGDDEEVLVLDQALEVVVLRLVPGNKAWNTLSQIALITSNHLNL